MEDQPISFETAKLAKEKGFDWPVDKMYNKRGNLTGVKLGMHGNPNNYADFYSAPTQSLLQKWLREKRDIELLIYTMTRYKDHSTKPPCRKVIIDDFKEYQYSINGDISTSNDKGGNTYEEALEKGLQEALKLI